MAKPLKIIVLAATLIGVLMGVKSLLLPAQYFPYVDIAAPEGIRIQILQKGHVRSTRCAIALESQLAAINGSCPACRIEASDCLADLDSAQQQWLGEEPIATASVRMAYGVIVFEASQQEVALAACQGSEKKTGANASTARLKCFPANTKRPLLDVEQRILERDRSEWQKSFAIASVSILGLFVLAVALLASIRRFAVRAPLEDASVGNGSGQKAAFKLSNIVKRVADIVLASILLVILLPVFSLCAALILILEGTPIFYMSRRFILADKSVTIFKFRTMARDATSPKYRLRERFMRDGYLDIPLTCEVYTPIGRLLERSQLVETLQLLNILFDGMSFVGNRPLPKDNIDLLQKFDGWKERFDSPAGITGISQITGKYGLLPQQRLYLERLYSSVYKNPNGNIILCDIYILAYTVFLLFTGRYLEFGKAVAFLIRCGGSKGFADDVLQVTAIPREGA